MRGQYCAISLSQFQCSPLSAYAYKEPSLPRGGLLILLVTWVTTKLPRDFGFVRSRWTCECLARFAELVDGGSDRDRGKGEGRNSLLFLRHLEDLRTRLRCYRKIHVICDNAIFHDCRAVHDYKGKFRW